MTPQYDPALDDEALKQLLEDGALSVGSLDDLAHLAGRLEALDEWVHTLEVTECRGGRELGRIDLSIMGLDGEDEWEVPLEPARMRALLQDKLARMRETGAAFRFDLWLGETAEDPA
ncbi:hypothetical protein FAZ78_02835 [Cereibacter changlensis]|uniref:Uncharacterized protein n=1 Tax=Cereibacter changlensis TaxID=402884 RepID=A0A4V5NM34_9RHOB|nr:hypothetical protein [Cereibacter changlensis]TKA98067.1 hypothetical protein FAZ78_02835 [Cereibacter changlensis]